MKEFEFMLAPMERFSTPEFRKQCYENGADSTFTEMVRISALDEGHKKALEQIDISNSVPTYIQLIGSNEKKFDRFLKNYKPQEGFLGFNLNLGCPSPNRVQSGQGCALIKRISKVKKIVQIIKNHGFPASIKLRLGLNRFEKDKKVYLNLIKEVDADFFIVHARHGKETNKDPADFEAYKGCVKTKKVIIANGDITTKEQIEYLKSIGVKGAMIGSAALNNPNIFNELKGEL